MRGPHNIWRLIRTGATLERTGAMNVILDAFDAPRIIRIIAHTLGVPFMWLGFKGDPTLPPATRALTAILDPPRCGWAGSGGSTQGASG